MKLSNDVFSMGTNKPITDAGLNPLTCRHRPFAGPVARPRAGGLQLRPARQPARHHAAAAASAAASAAEADAAAGGRPGEEGGAAAGRGAPPRLGRSPGVAQGLCPRFVMSNQFKDYSTKRN